MRVSSSSGTTITLVVAPQYPHPNGTPVYNIDRNQIRFSRGTTVVAADSSTLATVEIDCDQLYTTYEDTTNTTGFGFARAMNSADSTFSNYSESFPYAGYGENSLKKIFDSASTVLCRVPIYETIIATQSSGIASSPMYVYGGVARPRIESLFKYI